MGKIMKKLMRKIMGVPENVKLNYINISAESMDDAESMLVFMCKSGMLEGEPNKWSVWTCDGKSFVIEESVEERTYTDFFDFAEDDEEIII